MVAHALRVVRLRYSFPLHLVAERMNAEALIRVLEESGLEVSPVAGGEEITIACPLCFSDSKKLYINTSSGLWICHICGERGNLARIFLDLCDKNLTEAMHLVKDIRGTTERPRRPLSVRRLKERPLEVAMAPGALDRPLLAAAYLESRGLDAKWVKEVGIKVCLSGQYKGRVIIPIYTEGQLRTFVARSWDIRAKKKVLMPEDSSASKALFGYDRVVEGREFWTSLIIVEGVFDAMRMWQLGYGETVATLGAHITEDQRRLLKRLKPNGVILLRDADTAGQVAIIKEARELKAAMFNVFIAELPQGTDPGSAPPVDIKYALDTAWPVLVDYGSASIEEVQR